MDIYLIVTRNGTFVSIGKDEHEAKINFSQVYPSEKIRDIQVQKEKALQVSDMITDLDG